MMKKDNADSQDVVTHPSGMKIGVFKKRKWFKFPMRIVLLIVMALAVSGCGIGGYYLYSDYRDKQLAAEESRTAEAREKLKDTYFSYSGDEDRKVEYTKLIGQGKDDAAIQLYELSISAAGSEDEKAWIYKELFNVAYHLGHYEHARQGAIGYAEIRKSLDSYQAVVVACEKVVDNACQIKYLQIMYDSLDTDAEASNPVREDIKTKLGVLGVEV